MGGVSVADLATDFRARSVPSPLVAVMALIFLFILTEVVSSDTDIYFFFFFFWYLLTEHNSVWSPDVDPLTQSPQNNPRKNSFTGLDPGR